MKQHNKKITRDPILLDITKLAQNIAKAQAKNNIKYTQIKDINPDFQLKLYKPTIPSYEHRQQLSLVQDIMMRQIDKLMDQQDKLNIQLDKSMFKYNEQQRKIQKQIILNMDHYTFLRKLWKKDQSYQKSQSKIDKLIHNVGAIKGHIFNLIKKGTQINSSSTELHELIISSPQYCHLLKQYLKLKQQLQLKQSQAKNDNTNTTISQIQIQDTKKINQQLQTELSKLKLQLVNKNNEVQRLKRTVTKILNGKYNDSQLHKYKQDQECKQNQGVLKQKLLNYQIKSHEGRYLIKIQQLGKFVEKQQIHRGQNQKQYYTEQIQSRKSLESILRFIKNVQSQRITRLSFTSVQKKDTEFRSKKQNETASKKYTVEQIAKPKFISNRQFISSSRTNDTLPIQ